MGKSSEASDKWRVLSDDGNDRWEVELLVL
jgi:hypothetical protein